MGVARPRSTVPIGEGLRNRNLLRRRFRPDLGLPRSTARNKRLGYYSPRLVQFSRGRPCAPEIRLEDRRPRFIVPIWEGLRNQNLLRCRFRPDLGLLRSTGRNKRLGYYSLRPAQISRGRPCAPETRLEDRLLRSTGPTMNQVESNRGW